MAQWTTFQKSFDISLRNKFICLTTFFIASMLLAGSTACQEGPRIEKRFLLGKHNSADQALFKILPKELSSRSIKVLQEVHSSFASMAKKAAKAGITLKVVSGYRPFAHQKRIWEGKYNGKRLVNSKDLSETIPDVKKRALKILEFSSMPGTSRHHWGTDIDINNLENSYFSFGKGLKEYNWLLKNAADFGFCQVYTAKTTGRTGYEEEKWHWSYMPIAKDYLNAYLDQVQYNDISGFAGSEAAATIDVIKNYVFGIDSDCYKSF
jgi:zinc D-Ala-D-Ala carboxypeptidase